MPRRSQDAMLSREPRQSKRRSQTTDFNGEKDHNFVEALARGLDLLAQFTPERPRLTLTELSRRLELPVSTVHRLLHTLSLLGYVEVEEGGKRYFPGPRVMSLGYATLANMDLREIALPYLEVLSSELHETVNMTERDGYDIVYTARIAVRRIVSIDIQVGTRLPIHSTACGRCLIAFLPEAERMSFLNEYFRVEQNIRHRAPLIEQISVAEREGYTYNDEESAVGVRAVAAPIWGPGNQLAAAVNVSVPSARYSLAELLGEIAPKLFDCAKKISLSAGADETWIDGGWLSGVFGTLKS